MDIALISKPGENTVPVVLNMAVISSNHSLLFCMKTYYFVNFFASKINFVRNPTIFFNNEKQHRALYHFVSSIICVLCLCTKFIMEANIKERRTNFNNSV